MKMIRLLPCLFLLLASGLLYGCERERPEETTSVPPALRPVPPDATAVPALTASLPSERVEAIGQGLAHWRPLAPMKPVLLFFAADPHLRPLPEEAPPIAEPLLSLPSVEILRRTSPDSPDPLFLPDMALRAAAESGFFSGIRWIIPAAPEGEAISLDAFRREMVDSGQLATDEANSFRLEGDRFIGEVSGIPFEAIYLDRMDAYNGTAVLHFDLSFLRPLYLGDVSTPLYDLTLSVLESVRRARQPAVMATVSVGNLSGDIPLEMRFLGAQLQAIFQEPALMEDIPSHWRLFQDGIMLENLMAYEKMFDAYARTAEAAPDDPAAWFGLYRGYRHLKKGGDALDALTKAVQLDSIYALEYLALSRLANQRNRPGEALRMLQLAEEALPANPFIRMDLAAHLIASGHKEDAHHLLLDLVEEDWSPIYYPHLPEQLDRALNELQERKDQR